MTPTSPVLISLDAFRHAVAAETRNPTLRTAIVSLAVARTGAPCDTPRCETHQLGVAAVIDLLVGATKTLSRFVGIPREDDLSTRKALVTSLRQRNLDHNAAAAFAEVAWGEHPSDSPLAREEVRTRLCLDIVAPLCGIARWVARATGEWPEKDAKARHLLSLFGADDWARTSFDLREIGNNPGKNALDEEDRERLLALSKRITEMLNMPSPRHLDRFP